jgi:hypothetical protein
MQLFGCSDFPALVSLSVSPAKVMNDGDEFAELALLHTLILTHKKVG